MMIERMGRVRHAEPDCSTPAGRDYGAVVERDSAWADSAASRAVGAVLRGDREAFRVLVERESPSVLRICQRVLGNRDDAREAAQETFVAAFRSLGTWREDGPFAAWIARIAVHAALRRARERRELTWIDPTQLDSIDEERVGLAGDRMWGAVGRAMHQAAVDATATMDPESVAIHSEQGEDVRSAVAALDKPYREVVALRFFAELTVPEIAAVTGRPDGTVKTHLHRGLLRLRESLSGVEP